MLNLVLCTEAILRMWHSSDTLSSIVTEIVAFSSVNVDDSKYHIENNFSRGMQITESPSRYMFLLKISELTRTAPPYTFQTTRDDYSKGFQGQLVVYTLK